MSNKQKLNFLTDLLQKSLDNVDDINHELSKLIKQDIDDFQLNGNEFGAFIKKIEPDKLLTIYDTTTINNVIIVPVTHNMNDKMEDNNTFHKMLMNCTPIVNESDNLCHFSLVYKSVDENILIPVNTEFDLVYGIDDMIVLNSIHPFLSMNSVLNFIYVLHSLFNFSMIILCDDTDENYVLLSRIIQNCTEFMANKAIHNAKTSKNTKM